MNQTAHVLTPMGGGCGKRDDSPCLSPALSLVTLQTASGKKWTLVKFLGNRVSSTQALLLFFSHACNKLSFIVSKLFVQSCQIKSWVTSGGDCIVLPLRKYGFPLPHPDRPRKMHSLA